VRARGWPPQAVRRLTRCRSRPQANTQQILHRTQGMSHTEGGWPKDVDCTEAEHVIRFRRKVEKDEDYVRSIISLGCQARRWLASLTRDAGAHASWHDRSRR